MTLIDTTLQPDSRDSGLEQDASDLAGRYARLAAEDLLEVAIRQTFPDRIAVVSAFGAESAVLLALVAKVAPETPVIFLDTGKHFAETLTYRDRLIERLGLTNLRIVGPDPAVLERQDPKGQLWEHSPDFCCHLRKVVPLARALEGYDAWITGRKRFHGDSRSFLAPVETVDGRVKINPLADWSLRQIGEAFRELDLPRHPLTEQGYASIGCAPCTRPVAEGEAPRAGRWADRSKTECGIHGSAPAGKFTPQNP